MPTHPLNLANIEKAALLIDPINPAFLHSPQYEDRALDAALGRFRSCKGRGADVCARSLDHRQKIVCASAGNFGQSYGLGRPQARHRPGSFRRARRATRLRRSVCARSTPKLRCAPEISRMKNPMTHIAAYLTSARMHRKGEVDFWGAQGTIAR